MGRDYTPADVYRAMGELVPPVWAEFEAQVREVQTVRTVLDEPTTDEILAEKRGSDV